MHHIIYLFLFSFLTTKLERINETTPMRVRLHTVWLIVSCTLYNADLVCSRSVRLSLMDTGLLESQARGVQIFIGCVILLEAGLYVLYFRKHVTDRKYMYPHYLNLTSAVVIFLVGCIR